MNKFRRCFTPTSLWSAFCLLGTGKYKVIVTKNSANNIDNIKIVEVPK